MKRTVTIRLVIFLVTLLIAVVPSFSYAVTWTGISSLVLISLSDVASDSDGSNLIVAQNPGFKISSNGGSTWTLHNIAGGFGGRRVASDADGSFLAAIASDNLLYLSSDGGTNWTQQQPADAASVFDVAVDSDGSNIIISADIDEIYTSNDGGETWTDRHPEDGINIQWYVASDADGSNLIVGGVDGDGVDIGLLYTSDDSGGTWTKRQPDSVDGSVQAVASDADGSNLFVSHIGRLYTSDDNGDTWTERQPQGDVVRPYLRLASDDDGSTLFAVGSTAGNEMVYSSANGGIGWTIENVNGGLFESFYAGDVDADGSDFIVVGDKAYISPNDFNPYVTSLDPSDGGTEVSITPTLSMTFSESVATSSGNITIYASADDSVVEAIDVTSGQVSVSGDTATIVPSIPLNFATDYYILADASTFSDLAGNGFSGIFATTTWNFTTDGPPVVSSFSPEDDAIDVSINPAFSLDFDGTVVASSGNITLNLASDDSIVETFDVTDGGVVDVSGSTVTLTSAVTLEYETGYYFLIDAGAFEDESGNPFAGISDSTTWSFTTEAAIPLATLDFERVNVSDADGEADGYTETPAVSSDGRYVAFASESTNLVADDTNGSGDIFVYDRTLDTIERVSVADGNVESDDNSYGPTISSDGRYVAFTSDATNLVAGDTNDVADVFVYDRTLDTIERVSVADGAVESDNLSANTSISADGRHVAFSSHATNLVADDTNGQEDVFVYDRTLDTIERVSVADGNVESDGGSRYVSISGDGRYVAFESGASDLVAGDVNDVADVFVYDRTLDTIERVSVDDEGNGGDAESYVSGSNKALSDDGRFVTFWSTATNLVADDTNNFQDVFVYDRTLNTVERIGDGVEYSQNPSISGDGRYVVFRRTTDDGGGSALGIYRYDRDEDTLLFVTEGALLDGDETSNSSYSVLSEDGLTVVFVSNANNLVANDINGQGDVFVYEESVVTPGDDDDDEEPETDSVRGGGSHRHTSSGDEDVVKLMEQLVVLLKQLFALLQV